MFTIEILQLLISVIFAVIKKIHLLCHRFTVSYSKKKDLINISEDIYNFKKIRENVNNTGNFVEK